MSSPLPEKCPYSEFFWSVFSRIRTAYGQVRYGPEKLQIQTLFTLWQLSHGIKTFIEASRTNSILTGEIVFAAATFKGLRVVLFREGKKTCGSLWSV